MEISAKSSKTRVKPPKTKNRPTLIARLALRAVNRLTRGTDVDIFRIIADKTKTTNP